MGEPSFFDGLGREEIARLFARLPRRHFDAGTTVVLQGDRPNAIFVVLAGRGEVLVSGPLGASHVVGYVGQDSTFGEMSLLTGNTAAATVRAVTDLEVLVIAATDFDRIVADSPQIYRNLGAILSARLARTNQRLVHQQPGRLTVLADHGAPPLLGYSLACSLAWHLRRPVLLLAVAGGDASYDLRRVASDPANLQARLLAERERGGRSAEAPLPRASVVVSKPDGPFLTGGIHERLTELTRCYEHVLVQVPAAQEPPGLEAPVIRLEGAASTDSRPAEGRPGHTIRACSAGHRTGRPESDGVLNVPDLSQAEKAALPIGSLGPDGPAGRSLGWAARHIAGLKVGLALGAGSVRGYAHVGVLRVLKRAGVPVDYVAGTSVGAAVAAGHSMGYEADEIADMLDQAGMNLFRVTVPTRSILSSGGLRSSIRSLVGDRLIEDLPIPFAAVAADILSGREVEFRSGPMGLALLASMSIPGIYPPLRLGPQLLVDGGIVNPVPTNVVDAMGSDVTIAVKLMGAKLIETGHRGPSVLQVLLRSMDMMMDKIDHESASRATILVEPEFSQTSALSLRNFSQGRRYVAVGEAAAEAALPRIAAVIPWLRSVELSPDQPVWNDGELALPAGLEESAGTGRAMGPETSR
jgi:NTE family protein